MLKGFISGIFWGLLACAATVVGLSVLTPLPQRFAPADLAEKAPETVPEMVAEAPLAEVAPSPVPEDAQGAGQAADSQSASQIAPEEAPAEGEVEQEFVELPPSVIEENPAELPDNDAKIVEEGSSDPVATAVVVEEEPEEAREDSAKIAEAPSEIPVEAAPEVSADITLARPELAPLGPEIFAPTPSVSQTIVLGPQDLPVAPEAQPEIGQDPVADVIVELPEPPQTQPSVALAIPSVTPEVLPLPKVLEAEATQVIVPDNRPLVAPPSLPQVLPPTAEDDAAPSAEQPSINTRAAVQTGRLPQLGVPATTEETSQGIGNLDNALSRFARPFLNPDQKPPFVILLRDTGDASIDLAGVAASQLPMTLVIDPSQPEAAQRAAIWRAAGQEVALSGAILPSQGVASDIEVALEAAGAVVPEALALVDGGAAHIDRALAQSLAPGLRQRGFGLVTWEAGVNAADQVAKRESLPASRIFRDLDAKDEAAPIIRRYLDRAAFKAQQEGQVVVIGSLRSATLAAIHEWSLEGRVTGLALAPLSAALAQSARR